MTRTICAMLLVAIMCFVQVSAHSHPGEDSQEVERPSTSSWAEEEVERAQTLGLVPWFGLGEDFRKPISREQFALVAMEYIAVQERYDSRTLCDMVGMYKASKDENGKIKPAFTDVNEKDTASFAYYIGLVEGRGNGVFDPEGLITRQEAAVMLTRAYSVCGGTLSDKEASSSIFTDLEEVADWAKSSVTVLESWKIMNGMGNGAFAPEGQYSIEQCILTFLRLYELAPVSRVNGNVKAIFGYEQCIEYLDARTTMKNGYTETLRVDGAKSTFIRQDLFGWPSPRTDLFLVYKDGGIVLINDIGLCSEPSSHRVTDSIVLKECSFSEDGSTFLCTAILSSDVRLGEIICHEKGSYQIEVNIDTYMYELQKIN